jgi:DNA-binding CsgD family transcriptional regulator
LAAFCLVEGRIPEAIGWSERAAAAGAAPAAVRHDALVMRGMVRVLAEDARSGGPVPPLPLGSPRPARAAAAARGVVDAAAAIRAAAGKEFLSLLPSCDWRSLEIDALVGLGHLSHAETALAEFEAALSPAGPPSAMVAAARLRGDLATAAGRQAAAAEAFETAWRHARDLRVPLAFAQLEISHARSLRAAGQPHTAVALLRSARRRLIKLGARPYLQVCDRELATAAPAGPETAAALPRLTLAEQAVARPITTGRSNSQTAAELYVSVETVEFHLGRIFAKLGIRSRQDLITRINDTPPSS